MKAILKYLLVLAMTGCIQSPVQIVSAAPEKSTEPDTVKITTDFDLDQVIDETIIESRFSIEKKTELDNLRVDLREKLQSNAIFNLKLRAQLFKELLSKDYNPVEVQVIQEMLQRNSYERNSLITQSIEITNVITGRTEINAAAEYLRRETFIVY